MCNASKESEYVTLEYNVEINVSFNELERLGRDTCIQRSTLTAWYKTLMFNVPQHSLTLRYCDVIDNPDTYPFDYALRCKFKFVIDGD